MASLQSTTVNGLLTVTGNTVRSGNSNITPWTQLYHCADADSTAECNPTYSCGWLHVRTPIPADNVAMGWNPIILEVVGYHTYSGEYVEDFKALLNTNGYNNDWYGSQIKVNDSYQTTPFVYRSTSTYGGYTRVCFAVQKIGCCCTGNLWVRWWNRSDLWQDYPWATTARNSNTAYF